MPTFNVTRFDDEHFRRTETYVKRIKKIYEAAIKEAARIGVSVIHDPSKPFFFKDFPTVKTRIEKVFDEISQEMEYVIIEGIDGEWDYANDKNDELLKSLFKTDKFPERVLARLTGRNAEALKAFVTRKKAGLTLSQRIWRQTKQFRSELEMALELGIADGRSADQLSQDIRQYLENPDKLFRRVRDERGVLRLSQHAKAYKPGQGIYRSSYKNAMRLARSEINTAYRTADQERWQKFDFIVGYKISRSNNLTDCDVCSKLVGIYPKTFIFRGFHPACRCRCTSILASDAEFNRLEQMYLNGEDTSKFKSVNEVNNVPKGFTEWIKGNKERLLRAKSVPFFIADNFKGGTVAGGLRAGL